MTTFEMCMRLVEWVEKHPTASLKEYRKARDRIRRELEKK